MAGRNNRPVSSLTALLMILVVRVDSFTCGSTIAAKAAQRLPCNRMCSTTGKHRSPAIRASARPVQRQSKREALLAKGIAGAALLRVAASSQAAAISASLAMAVVVVTPVLAVEAMLLAMLLVVVGAANYWPANLMVACLGAVGVGGALNGLIVSWEKLQQRRASRRDAAVRRRPTVAYGTPVRESDGARSDGERMDDDGSGSLVALLVGALTAAIVGALP